MRAPDTLPPEIAADPRLVELAALIEEARPAAGAERLERIDARAARALAAPPPSWRSRPALRRGLWAPALGITACALLALVIGLSALRSRDLVTGSGREAAGAGASRSPRSPGSSAASAGSASDQAVAPGAPVPGLARKVERSVMLALGASPDDVDAVASAAARTATALGGYVASSSTSLGNGGLLELRVPSPRLDEAIARLSRLGHVRALERSTLDITAAAVSARGRLADARAERQSLLRQLAHAGTPGETERVRGRLRIVWRQIQSARAAVRRVDARAALATVSVEIAPERRSAGGGGWSPRDALRDALRVLEVALGIALVAFAVALPLALVGAPAWLAGRRLLRRRRERVLDAA